MVILAKIKGDYLKDGDSRQKVKLDRAWQNAAGLRYRYYIISAIWAR